MMGNDMKNGEIREYNGKKYKYVEQEAMESDMNWLTDCCEGCAFENKCPLGIYEVLGECYEGTREDERNGIFIEIEEG